MIDPAHCRGPDGPISSRRGRAHGQWSAGCTGDDQGHDDGRSENGQDDRLVDRRDHPPDARQRDPEAADDVAGAWRPGIRHTELSRSNAIVATALVDEISRRLGDTYTTLAANAFGTMRDRIARQLLD